MSKRKRLSAHDKFAKISLQNKFIARDFFKAHLPKFIQSKIDWTTLALQSGTFIDEDYHSCYTDVLYQVEIDNCASYLFVLVEHQSKPDKYMPLRLMNYLCKIWDRYLIQSSSEILKRGAQKKLPLIYPITLYHGKVSPYPYSMSFYDLFECRELAMSILMSKPFPLIDLTSIEEEQLVHHGYAAVMEMIQKNIFQRDILCLVEKLERHWQKIATLEHGSYLLKVLEYLLICGEIDSPNSLLETIIQAVPDQEDSIMTGAEVLRQEGMQKGMQKGMKQGLQRGILQVAKNLLAEGLSDAFIIKTTGLSLADLEKLKQDG